MGLDMYAYAAQKGQYKQYWEDYDYDTQSSSVAKPREIAYWRKHPNLHGWMEQLWKRKMHESNQELPDSGEWGSSFNGIELELTWQDLDQLEQDIQNHDLPSTTGFFFGSDADDDYRDQDLDFVRRARAELFLGLHVFYNSSW